MSAVVLSLEDAARVLALAEMIDNPGDDERAARDRVRDRVGFAEKVHDGVLELAGPIPRGSAVVLHEDPDRPLADEYPDGVDPERGRAYTDVIAELVRVAGHTEFTLVVLPVGDTVEVLDEDEMRALGWRRLNLADKIGAQSPWHP